MTNVLTFIRDNPTLKPSEVHRRCFTTCRQFQRYTGTSIKSELRNARVERAKQMLLRDEYVSFVAKRLGYQHVQSFINTFRRITGMSPRRWKVMHKGVSEMDKAIRNLSDAVKSVIDNARPASMEDGYVIDHETWRNLVNAQKDYEAASRRQVTR